MFFKDISDNLKNSLLANSDIFVMPSIIHKSSVVGFGFDYVEDIIDAVSENEYETYRTMLRFHAKALGCEVEDLAYVDSEEKDYGLSQQTYQAIIAMLRERKPQGVDVPGNEEGNFGYNQMYDLDGLKLLYTNNHGYETFTICGQ